MNDTTTPLHPMEREQLRAESTLVVTVNSSSEFHDDVTDDIAALERGDAVDSPPTLSFTSYDDLMEALTPRVLDLIEVIRRDEPASINETARVVDREVRNIHEELTRLAKLGIIFLRKTASGSARSSGSTNSLSPSRSTRNLTTRQQLHRNHRLRVDDVGFAVAADHSGRVCEMPGCFQSSAS